jgi:hypothetical protein
LPWFTPTVAPYVTAQALPNFYSLNRFRIYLTKYDESRAQCLADVVHEAFHIMQAMEFQKGYGFGFFRGFLLYYIAVFLKHGYRQNPFEIPAYDQEYKFLHYCIKHGLHGITPKVSASGIAEVAKEPELIFKKFDFKYKESFLFLMASFMICTVITVTRPLADLFVFVVGLFIPGRPVLPKKIEAN